MVVAAVMVGAQQLGWWQLGGYSWDGGGSGWGGDS